MPILEAYFCMFSSAVPSQLVPSITHAFHEFKSRVAARMASIVSEFNGGKVLMFSPDEVAPIVDWLWSCVGPEKSPLSLPPAGSSRLKDSDSLSNTPSDEIQSCQGPSTGTGGAVGWNGWNPPTPISSIINKHRKGTSPC